MGSRPAATIIMPVHNAAEFLGQAIESCLAQTFGDFELLICDDGSDEACCDIVASYHLTDKRIISIWHRENKGFPARFNEMVRKARGDVIFQQHADDSQTPDRMAKMMALVSEDTPIASCGVKALGPDGGAECRGRQYLPPTPPIVAMKFVYGENSVGPHDGERFPSIHDYAWCRKAKAMKVPWAVHLEWLYLYRTHADQHSLTTDTSTKLQERQLVEQLYGEL